MKSWVGTLSTEIKKVTNTGPKAFCTGTILPCPAGSRCGHFGIHNCSTFKKHSKHACPHHSVNHDFKCIRLEGETLEEEITQ